NIACNIRHSYREGMLSRTDPVIEIIDPGPALIIGEPQPFTIQFGPEGCDTIIVFGCEADPAGLAEIDDGTTTQGRYDRWYIVNHRFKASKIAELGSQPVSPPFCFPDRGIFGCSFNQDFIPVGGGDRPVGFDTDFEIGMYRNRSSAEL